MDSSLCSCAPFVINIAAVLRLTSPVLVTHTIVLLKCFPLTDVFTIVRVLLRMGVKEVMTENWIRPSAAPIVYLITD
uniref:Secreted protein n=1 Tax=Angiostrongylus cantonensis TaxID=6313 RepID=A0A0K0D910_ANGCA